MIKINSYTNINVLRFGSNEAEARDCLGQPIERSVNCESEAELYFPWLYFTI